MDLSPWEQVHHSVYFLKAQCQSIGLIAVNNTIILCNRDTLIRFLAIAPHVNVRVWFVVSLQFGVVEQVVQGIEVRHFGSPNTL